MHRRAHGRDIVPGAHRLGQLQHPHEVGRHELACVAAMLLDQSQGGLGVEPLHDHHRAADPLDGHAPAQGRGVIERRRRQIDAVLAEAEQRLDHHLQGVRRVDRPAGQRRLDALGPPGGAGGIEHVGTGRLVGDRRGRQLAQRLFQAGVGRGRPADHVQLHARDQGRQFVRQRRQGGRGDQDLGPAILDDVGDLGRRQLGRDTGVVEPGPLGRPGDLEVAGIVLHHQGDDVAWPQAQRAEEVRALVRSLVELAIGHRLAGAGHHIGGAVGSGPGVYGRMHGASRRWRLPWRAPLAGVSPSWSDRSPAHGAAQGRRGGS